jgi:RNA polymerase sigma-70 factor (ECF subfamily)
MDRQPSDIELLRRIGDADREAFRTFYDRHGARVLSYVRVLARGRDACEDIVQEVFLAVWRKAASYRPERGDVPGWLYTITRNKFVDLWRQGRAAHEECAIDEHELGAEDPSAARTVLSVTLEKVLGTLKPEHRQALELAYFGGLTYEETAARLRLPIGTLKTRIRSALLLLRERLTERRS